MKVISVENLTKIYRVPVKGEGFWEGILRIFRRKYRDIVAVDGITFSVEEGEILGFLGPNGAGKTTTLKMLTGLIYPTSGRVEVLGFKPYERKKEFLKSITLVMGQKQQLIWDLPPMDTFRINAEIYEIPKDVFKRRVYELAEMLAITHILHQPVRKLSLGERMKAELVASLIHFPKILFLDEPTIGLDVSAQISIRQFLKDYNEKYKATIILTSHYMEDIEVLCDRVILIHKGKMIFDGDLYDIVDKIAPYKEITVKLKGTLDIEAMRKFGEIREVEGTEVRIIVNREEVFEKINEILRNFPVEDFSVTDPPLEEVISRVFSGSEI
ncbi:ABC transporter ATP-binding protein [Candidatus Caldipriscus sp.]|nr:ABC transporter ATP-binding protein [Candidatus Caldipriscus sp.]